MRMSAPRANPLTGLLKGITAGQKTSATGLKTRMGVVKNAVRGAIKTSKQPKLKMIPLAAPPQAATNPFDSSNVGNFMSGAMSQARTRFK